jgi:hypothetical protein
MFKRFVIGLMLACYAVPVFAVLPQASVMTHGVGEAVLAAHHDCDDETAPVAAVVDDDEGCADCARTASPCCTGLLALPMVNRLQLSPPVFTDRPGHRAGGQPVSRGESIYRPPRA